MNPVVEIYTNGEFLMEARFSDLKFLEELGYIQRIENGSFVLTDAGKAFASYVERQQTKEQT